LRSRLIRQLGHRRAHVGLHDHAILVNVALLTSVYWGLIRLGRRARYEVLGVHHWTAVFSVGLIAYLASQKYKLALDDLVHDVFVIAAAVVAAPILLYLGIRFRKPALAVLGVFVTLLIGFVPMTFVQAAMMVREAQSQSVAEHGTAPLLPGNARVRVVWIVFDELDGAISFKRRPAGLELPEFDRLRSQSLFLENAFQAGLNTDISMTSFITGRQATAVNSDDFHRMQVSFDHTQEPKFQDVAALPNIFQRTRELGMNSGMVAWHIPFCRLLGKDLNYCHFEPRQGRTVAPEPGLLRTVWMQMGGLFPLDDRADHLDNYRALMEHGTRMAADPRLGLVLLHLNVPHHPLIYDRFKDEITIWNFGTRWYLHNLELTDKTLGRLRAEMEQAGVWDDTTVIVTGDHCFRAIAGGRVPMLIKPAKHHGGEVAYAQAVNVMFTHDLALALLRQEVQTPAQITAWLDQHAAKVPDFALKLEQRLLIDDTKALDKNPPSD
jgi:hypothetical protein